MVMFSQGFSCRVVRNEEYEFRIQYLRSTIKSSTVCVSGLGFYDGGSRVFVFSKMVWVMILSSRLRI